MWHLFPATFRQKFICLGSLSQWKVNAARKPGFGHFDNISWVQVAVRYYTALKILWNTFCLTSFRCKPPGGFLWILKVIWSENFCWCKCIAPSNDTNSCHNFRYPLFRFESILGSTDDVILFAQSEESIQGWIYFQREIKWNTCFRNHANRIMRKFIPIIPCLLMKKYP